MAELGPDELKKLLTQIDSLCAEAAKIREKLAEAATQTRPWPERRQDSRIFLEPAEAHDLATVPSSERSN